MVIKLRGSTQCSQYLMGMDKDGLVLWEINAYGETEAWCGSIDVTVNDTGDNFHVSQSKKNTSVELYAYAVALGTRSIREYQEFGTVYVPHGDMLDWRNQHYGCGYNKDNNSPASTPQQALETLKSFTGKS